MTEFIRRAGQYGLKTVRSVTLNSLEGRKEDILDGTTGSTHPRTGAFNVTAYIVTSAISVTVTLSYEVDDGVWVDDPTTFTASSSAPAIIDITRPCSGFRFSVSGGDCTSYIWFVGS